MKTFNIIFLILIALPFSNATSQKLSLNIGESTTNSLTKNKPAQVVATFPESDSLKDSWLMDAFIELKLNNLLKYGNLGFFTEFHKNNLIGKEQDIYQLGLSVENDFPFYDKSNQLFFRIISNSNIKYSNNIFKKKEEFQGNIGFSFSLEKTKHLRFLQTNTRLININSLMAKFFTLSHNHNLGLGYIGGNENVLLGDASFDLSIFPLSGFTNKIKQPELIRLNWSINARTPLLGNTNIDLNTLNYLSVGLNYALNKSSIGISYSWQKGANPYTRLENQEFKTLSAKFKITI